MLFFVLPTTGGGGGETGGAFRFGFVSVKQMTVDSGAETTDSDELILPHHQLHHPKDYDNGTRRKDSVNNGDLEDSVADSDKENTFTDDDDDTDVDGGRNAGYVKSSRQRRGTSGHTDIAYVLLTCFIHH